MINPQYFHLIIQKILSEENDLLMLRRSNSLMQISFKKAAVEISQF